MKKPLPLIFILACISTFITLPALSQGYESDEPGLTPGHWEYVKQNGRMVAQVSDPYYGASFIAGCLEGVVGFKFVFSESGIKYAENADVIISFDFLSGRIEANGTSLPSKGFVASYSNEKNQIPIVSAYRKIISMKSDDIATIMIIHPNRGNIEAISISGSGSAKALGAVLKECGK